MEYIRYIYMNFYVFLRSVDICLCIHVIGGHWKRLLLICCCWAIVGRAYLTRKCEWKMCTIAYTPTWEVLQRAGHEVSHHLLLCTYSTYEFLMPLHLLYLLRYSNIVSSLYRGVILSHPQHSLHSCELQGQASE